MARKSNVTATDDHNVKHPHCEVCGGCLIHPIRHRCPEPVDPAVLEVFIADTRPQNVRQWLDDVRAQTSTGFQVVEVAGRR